MMLIRVNFSIRKTVNIGLSENCDKTETKQLKQLINVVEMF